MVQYTVRPEGLPRPLGKYSHISIAPASELVSIAGQLGVQEDGKLPGDGAFDAQAQQAFHNIMVALKQADCGPADVLKFTTYLRHADDIEPFMEARNRVFADMYPDGVYPPNTLLIVQRLVEDRFRVEIEALAAR